MGRLADYVYRNADDSKRVRVFRRGPGNWDFDVFHRWLKGGWHSDTGIVADAANTLRTKAEALEWAEDRIGGLTPCPPADTVTAGWPERPLPKSTKDAGVRIRVGQVWRYGSRKGVVRAYYKHWSSRQVDMGASPMQVDFQFTDASGRERGTMIRGRRSSVNAYGEQKFREKFRFVREPGEKP